ncbi:MAG: type II toxin-antitoxin system VapC family toxin [Bryobacteraceae bacterium]|nr:type II toxin-antitoxin system VapC family toxin [Bryobacteraceae bacterium]
MLSALTEGTPAFVPRLWKLEVANALVVGERRGKISRRDANDFLDFAESLPTLVDPAEIGYGFPSVLLYARELQLTVYDATYLELAARRALPLATKDEPLAQAAARIGVGLFEP